MYCIKYGIENNFIGIFHISRANILVGNNFVNHKVVIYCDGNVSRDNIGEW